MNITEWSLRKRLWIGVPTVAATCLVALLIVSLIASFGTSGAPAPLRSHDASQAYQALTEDPKAADERVYTQQWVGDKLPAYACNGKTEVAQFKKNSDLVFCPDFTVTIKLKGDKVSDLPVITGAANGPIKVTPVHHGDWVNNSDTLGKTVWVEGWYFEVTYESSVIPAGINEQYNYTYLNNGKLTSWTGPLGYGLAIGQVNSSGALVTQESFSDSTVYVEIYAASRDLAVAGNAIDPAKDPR